MEETQLEQTMMGFLRGEADVLATTTIIESGLDIPTANTLIVERADRLGLAQAYQIRGRVGRSRERAFAYLLYPSAEALTEEAAARLSTLADHTELGSGFKIAMRDLDIRGAGDLLGDEQSGHVAAVGFELYCQMIDEAVAEGAAREGEEGAEEPEPLRFDVPVDAYLPASYVPFEAAKIDIHRRVVAARAPGELRAIRDELDDRFGAPPREAENLLALQRARIELRLAGARSVELRGGRLSVVGVELDSEGSGALAERVEGALYEWREKTASMRVPEEPQARLAAVLALAEGAARGGPLANGRKRYAPSFVSPNQGGKGTGKGAGGKAPGPAAARRLGLLVFGAAFVVLFVVVAIAEGIGSPSVPSGDVALVESVPSEVGEVTQAKFDHALELASKQGGEKKTPKPGSAKYEELKETALNALFESIWLQGQAEEWGISVSDKEVAKELEETEERKLQIGSRIQEIPQGIRLQRGRRRTNG